MNLGTTSRLRAAIRADFRQLQQRPNARTMLTDPVARFHVVLRINEYLKDRGTPMLLRLVPYLWYRRLSVRLGFTVPLGVCSPGLAIIHYGLLVIADRAHVGRNCRMHMGVHIGGAKGGWPRIGANCYLGPGAKIYGPITIGSNCKIGANAVVNRSFPDGCTLVGVPAR